MSRSMEIPARGPSGVPLGLAQRLQPRERVIAQQAEETLVLLDVDEGSYFALDEVGARVWELCDGTRGVESVLSAVCGEYDAPPDVVRRDVLELLEALLDERLLVPRS